MEMYVVYKKDSGVAYKGWTKSFKVTGEYKEGRCWVPVEKKVNNSVCYYLTNQQKKEIEDYCN